MINTKIIDLSAMAIRIHSQNRHGKVKSSAKMNECAKPVVSDESPWKAMMDQFDAPILSKWMINLKNTFSDFLGSQFLRFAVVGVVSTLTTLAFLKMAVEFLDLRVVIASVPAYLAGAGVNYFLNYRLTFRSVQLHRVAIPRFLVVMVFAVILNTCIMYYTVYKLGIHYLLAQFVAVAVVMIWSFITNRFWTFAR